MVYEKRVWSDKRTVWHNKNQVWYKNGELYWWRSAWWYKLSAVGPSYEVWDCVRDDDNSRYNVTVSYDGKTYQWSLWGEDRRTQYFVISVSDFSGWDEDIAAVIKQTLEAEMQKFAYSWSQQMLGLEYEIRTYDWKSETIKAWVDSALRWTNLDYTKVFAFENWRNAQTRDVSYDFWIYLWNWTPGTPTAESWFIIGNANRNWLEWQWWDDSILGQYYIDMYHDNVKRSAKYQLYNIGMWLEEWDDFYLSVLAVPTTFTEPQPRELPDEFVAAFNYLNNLVME